MCTVAQIGDASFFGRPAIDMKSLDSELTTVNAQLIHLLSLGGVRNSLPSLITRDRHSGHRSVFGGFRVILSKR